MLTPSQIWNEEPFRSLSDFWKNAIAFLLSLIILQLWLKLGSTLTNLRIIGFSEARKMTHIGTGPIFILCWNFFPVSPYARYCAGIIPLGMAVNVLVVGTKLIRDQSLVNTMSRSGNPSELLKGPLMYGFVFAISTMYFWASPEGIMALTLLCAGDGFAGLIGQKYGSSKLPWNSRKTWEGTISFIVSAFVFTEILIELFHQWKWFEVTSSSIFMPLLITTIIAAFVESLPYQNDWDNITVFVVGVFVLKAVM